MRGDFWVGLVFGLVIATIPLLAVFIAAIALLSVGLIWLVFSFEKPAGWYQAKYVTRSQPGIRDLLGLNEQSNQGIKP